MSGRGVHTAHFSTVHELSSDDGLSRRRFLLNLILSDRLLGRLGWWLCLLELHWQRKPQPICETHLLRRFIFTTTTNTTWHAAGAAVAPVRM